MSIDITVAYGIKITDDFGGSIEGYEEILDAVVDELGGEDEYSYAEKVWHTVCYSAVNAQLVLGFETSPQGLSDSTNNEKWKEIISKAPAKIQELLKKIPNKEPENIVMAGDY